MTSKPFKDGDYVTHVTLAQWGAGKVLEVSDGFTRVFFEYQGEKKMKPDFLTPIPKPANHPVLERIDPTKSSAGFKPFPDLEAIFLKEYPQGFSDPKYFHDERDYKVAASKLLHETQSRDTFSRLVDIGDYDTICNTATKLINKFNLMYPFEKMALRDGLKRGAEQREAFALTLFDLLYGEGDFGLRFDAFAVLLESLDACSWPAVTFFLFLLDPNKHIFVKPSYFQKAARIYAFEISYDSHPDVACYRRILNFVDYVAGQLVRRELLAPRDLIDVQSFIWCSLQGE